MYANLFGVIFQNNLLHNKCTQLIPAGSGRPVSRS